MSCSTESFLRAARTNATGIAKLQLAEYNKAIDHFTSGLETVLSCISTDGVSNAAFMYCNCKNCEAAMATEDSIASRVLSSVELSSQQKLADAHDDFFSLLPRALHLSEHMVPRTSIPTAYAHFLSGIILYNLGLSYHLKGLSRSNAHDLEKAMEFYNMSHVSLTTEQALLGIRVNSGLRFLNFALMSSTNNMGHIHAYFRNVEEVKSCGGELCRRLSPVVCSSFNGEEPAISNENEEYRVFFLNVCFYSESKLVAPPAA